MNRDRWFAVLDDVAQKGKSVTDPRIWENVESLFAQDQEVRARMSRDIEAAITEVENRYRDELLRIEDEFITMVRLSM